MVTTDLSALTLIKMFFTYGLVDKNIDKATALLSTEITWISSSFEKTIRHRQEIKNSLERRKSIHTFPCQLFFIEEKSYDLSLESSIAFLTLRIDDVLYNITATARLENGVAHLFSIHSSKQISKFEDQASKNIGIGGDKNKLLRQDFLNASIDGGMMGAFFEKDFPFNYIDEQMLRHLGYQSESEFIQDTDGKISHCIHPDDLDFVYNEITEQMMTSDTYSVEYRMRKKDHSYIWVHDVGKKIQTDAGKTMLMFVCYNITKQKEIQEQFLTAIDTLEGGFAVITTDKESDYRMIFVSDGFCKMIGMTREQILAQYGNHIFHDIHPDDLERTIHLFKNSAKNNIRFTHTFRYQLNQTNILWIKIQCVVKENREHEFLYYINYTDITEEKKIQQKLEQTSLQIDNIVNAIPGGIAIYKISDKFETIYFSDGVPALSGHTIEEYQELILRDAAEMIYAADKDRVLKEIDYAVKNNTMADVTFRKNHTSGKVVWVHLNGKKIGEQDGYPLFHAVFHNVSKETELYQEVLNESESAIYVCDTTTYELLYTNKASFTLQDKPVFNYTGMTCHKCVMESDTPCSFCDAPFLKKGVMHTKEVYIPQTKHYFSLRGTIIDWRGREAFIEYVTDITETKLAKEQLREKTETLENILKTAPCGIFSYTADEKSEFQFISEGTLKLLGYTLDEFQQKFKNSFNNLVYAQDREQALSEIKEQISHSDMDECTYRIETKSGELHWFYDKGFITKIDDNHKLFYVSIMDITKQKEIERENELNIQRLTAALKNSNLRYWEYDIPTSHAYSPRLINNNYNLNYIIENYPGSIIESGLVLEENVEEYQKIHRELREGVKEIETIQNYIDAHSKEMKWVRIKYTNVFDGIGKPIRAIGIAVDITEQMQAKKRYYEALSLREITAQKSFASFIINLTQNFVVSGNTPTNQFRNYLNLTVDEFFEKSLSFVEGEANKNKYLEIYDRKKLLTAFDNNQLNFAVQLQYQLENDKVVWFDMPISMMREPETGDVIGFTYAIDITDQWLNQEVINSIVQYGYDFVVCIFIDTNSFIMFSRTNIDTPMPSRKGNDYEDEVFQTCHRYVYPEDIDLCVNNMQIAHLKQELEKAKTYEFSIRIVENDGSISTKKQFYAYMDTNHKIILHYRTDITNMVVLQQQKNEALTHALVLANQANSAKTDFLSRMSHDIRTPMNAIMGMVELAKSNLDNQEQLKESCAIIETSSRYLMSILNDILDMSRLENGKIIFTKEKYHMKEELEKIVNPFRPIFANKQQTFTLFADNLTHAQCVMGDKQKLHRIFGNILNNASKFTPIGGIITFTVTELPSNKDKIAYFQFEVKDNGIGMTDEQQQHIFEPFYRAHESIAQHIEGTGLGLAIVKSIVEAKAGTITIKSQVGVGTTFIITLPEEVLSLSPQKQIIEPNIFKTNFVGIKALLVEDHPINTLVAKKFLENIGIAIVTAANGKLGYETFKNSHPKEFDIIFMDIQMPIMNGYEATQAIRTCSHPQAKTIPIIAMTANAFAQDIQNSLHAGMNAHLAKPIDPKALYETLTKFVGLNIKK